MILGSDGDLHHHRKQFNDKLAGVGCLYRKAVFVKIDRNSKKKDFPILNENPSKNLTQSVLISSIAISHCTVKTVVSLGHYTLSQYAHFNFSQYGHL